MPQGLTSSASQWCFFLILQPLLGQTGGEKLVSVSLGEQGRVGGVRHARGWEILGTWWCQLGDEVSWGASKVGELAEGVQSVRGRGMGVAAQSLPSRSNFTSLAALMPSSLRFFSIALLRSRAALSSALRVHPMVAPSLPQPARLGWHGSPARRAPHPPQRAEPGLKGGKKNHDILPLAKNKNVGKPEYPKRQPLARF